jgi:hypothetical protein
MTADEVHDKEGFIKLLAQMREELRTGAKTWENTKLDDFLEAMSAWVNDLAVACGHKSLDPRSQTDASRYEVRVTLSKRIQAYSIAG